MTEESRSESLVASGEDNLERGMPRRDVRVAAEDELEIGARIGWKLEDDPRPAGRSSRRRLVRARTIRPPETALRPSPR